MSKREPAPIQCKRMILQTEYVQESIIRRIFIRIVLNMLDNIRNVTMKPVAQAVYRGSLEWLIVAQSIYCVAVDSVGVYKHICAYFSLL